ncbi:hypothetical protein [Tomitella cavernea]|uniref:DUF2269 family protein n=1 Tax=Tomitella cavernea TaxID=1387982 RepID=A0ABP9BZD9_9ACTN|nr:hypothetical protein [Tomitella cavernea]
MEIAALVLWIITAIGGFILLAKWIAGGGAKPGGGSRLPAPVVFAHFLLAAAGLVLWIIYVVIDADALAWVSFALLVVIALAGFAMVARWLPVYQGTASGADAAPEKGFPVAVVGLHGVLAVATVVTVLLSALDIG